MYVTEINFCLNHGYFSFSVSQPKLILRYSYAGGKQEFLLSAAMEGRIDDLPVSIIVVNLSAAISA